MTIDQSIYDVWVLSNVHGNPLQLFLTRPVAIDWMRATVACGCLTRYPINMPIYTWSLSNGFFKIKRASQTTPEFIERFSCAYLEHYHFEYNSDGIVPEYDDNYDEYGYQKHGYENIPGVPVKTLICNLSIFPQTITIYVVKSSKNIFPMACFTDHQKMVDWLDTSKVKGEIHEFDLDLNTEHRIAIDCPVQPVRF